MLKIYTARIENRLYKRLSTGGYCKKTAYVNGPFTQAVMLCELPVLIDLHKRFT